jgi:hypothetical protein
MARFERYEPRAEAPVFDGAEPDDDEDDSSRLPVLLVIGLLVVAAFSGVVWLAYTQGVQRGRADTPGMLMGDNQATKPDQGAPGLKVYEQPAPSDDASGSDAAPQPSAPQTPPPQKADAAPANVLPAAPAAAPTPAVSITGPVDGSAVAPKQNLPPVQLRATKAPHPITPVVAAASPPKPAEPAPVLKPAEVAAPKPAETPAPTQIASAEPPPSSSAAAGAYGLQIGAYPSEAEAKAAWQTFLHKHPMAASYDSEIRMADLGAKGTWYRLRLGSFGARSDAAAFCEKLKADGGNCFVAK